MHSIFVSLAIIVSVVDAIHAQQGHLAWQRAYKRQTALARALLVQNRRTKMKSESEKWKKYTTSPRLAQDLQGLNVHSDEEDVDYEEEDDGDKQCSKNNNNHILNIIGGFRRNSSVILIFDHVENKHACKKSKIRLGSKSYRHPSLV